jgi:hypothetical protein
MSSLFTSPRSGFHLAAYSLRADRNAGFPHQLRRLSKPRLAFYVDGLNPLADANYGCGGTAAIMKSKLSAAFVAASVVLSVATAHVRPAPAIGPGTARSVERTRFRR